MDINKLRKEHQKHVRRIEDLEQQVAQAEHAKALAVEEAVRSRAMKIDQLIEENKKLNERWLNHSNELSMEVLAQKKVNEDLLATIRELQGSVKVLTERLGAEEMKVIDLKTELANVTPSLELKDQQIADLTALLAKVQDRMKRKEQEEQAAILNRKAVTFQGVSPSPRTMRKLGQ